MDSKKLIERIEAYERAYVEECRNQADRHSQVAESIPSFLHGFRRIDAHVGQDGAVVALFEAEEDEFSATHHPEVLTAQLARSVSEGLLQLGDGKPRSLSVGAAEVHRSDDATGEKGELVFRSSFEQIHIGDMQQWRSRSADLARSHAQAEVLTFVTAHLMGLVDIEPSSATEKVLEVLDNKMGEFESLLASDPMEEEVQQFLTRNPFLIHPTANRVIPKMKLGTEHVTDFVVEVTDGEFILVEIERPTHRLFTKTGDPTKEVRHAQTQVEDWQAWVRNNIDYARKSLLGIEEPAGWVVIGQSATLRREGHEALRRTNSALKDIRIMTFDALLGQSRRLCQQLRDL